MKLLFTDIDGTLIPLGSGHSYTHKELFPKDNLNAFNILMSSVDREDVGIVLSSCWASHFDNTTQLQYAMRRMGIHHADKFMGMTRHYGDRTESILMYLEMFTHTVCQPIDDILILDDETIVDPLDKYSIKLDSYIGFTTDHVNDAIKILTETKFNYEDL